MELILYILIGLLYSECLMAAIFISIFSTYVIIRFCFWIFEVFKIPNPVMYFLKILLKLCEALY